MRGTRGYALVLLAACGGAPAPGDDDDVPPGIDAPQQTTDAPAQIIDDDADGLDDAEELRLATAYLPFISIAVDDGCSRSGLLVRVRPHPQDATKILIVYDHLFETDCGLNGHTGDNEVFGVAIDPALPPPAGILAIRTASHQNTPCQRITECTQCTGDSRDPCDLAAEAGAMVPVIYASKDKHGQYATKSSCGFGTCFDSCSLNPTPAHPPIANAGEPDHHMIANLTTQGFITAANGWTKTELMNFDPWGAPDFGSAGNVAEDLIDATFEAGICN
jgi:hypothetical protein